MENWKEKKGWFSIMEKRILDILYEINDSIRGNESENLFVKGLLDSFELVNLVVELEDAFDIEIDPEDVVPDNFASIKQITQLIEKMVNNG